MADERKDPGWRVEGSPRTPPANGGSGKRPPGLEHAGEGRTLARHAADIEAATVAVEDVLDQRQSQSAECPFAEPASIHDR